MKNVLSLLKFSIVTTSLLSIVGCGDSTDTPNPTEGDSGLVKVILQTDWYAQPEHGGFYQALVEGFYKEEGLDVEILPGGPNTLANQKLAQNAIQFSIGRTDDIIIANARGLNLVIAGALMQKDPQALMFHQKSGIKSFKDLNGRAIMTSPGAAFIELMEAKFDIDIAIIPIDYGMSRFLSDKDFIQQVFITNEPYYVEREGAKVGTLLLSEMGFRPYRVWFTTSSYNRKHPEVVEAFTRASIKGWISYMTENHDEANALISSLNPKMDKDFMAFSHQTMLEYKLIQGDSDDWNKTGEVLPERIQEQIDQLYSIKMIDVKVPLESILTRKPIE